MGLRKFLFTIIFVVGLNLIVVAEETEEKSKSCFQKCGKVKGHAEAEKKGTMVCTKSEEKYFPSSPCEIECHGREALVAEDQAGCFCKICKNEDDPNASEDRKKEGNKHLFFCTSPGNGQLKSKEDCDTTVCAGKGDVKYYGFSCFPKMTFIH